MTYDGETMQGLQAALWDGATSAIARGFRIAMVRLEWDPEKGKKVLVRNPPKGWHEQPTVAADAVQHWIEQGCNAYLYRLPEGVHVVDADNKTAVGAVYQHLGKWPISTPRGAHWLVDGELAPGLIPDVDSAPRQLYGPGSFYHRPDGPRSYSGSIPVQVLPLPQALRAGVSQGVYPAQETPEPVPAQGGGGFFAPAPMTLDRARVVVTEQLDEIATGPKAGAAARHGILRAAMTLGGLLYTGWFTREQALAQLGEAVVRRWGMVEAPDEAWMAQGLDDGLLRPLPTRSGSDTPTLGKDGLPEDDGAPDLGERVLTLAELAELPRPEPMIEDLIDAGSLSLIYGAGGSGKSFVALDMMLSVGAGLDWQGVPTKRTKGLYVAGEGKAGIGARVAAWMSAHPGVAPDVAVVGDAVDIYGAAREKDIEALARTILRGGYGWVVIDTYNQCTPGLEENSAKDTGEVIKNLKILQKYGAAVTVIHHTPKDGSTPRGSASLEWATDHALRIENKSGAISVWNARQKDREASKNAIELMLVAAPGFDDTSAYLVRGSAAAKHSPLVDYDPNKTVDTGAEVMSYSGPGASILNDVAQTMAHQAGGKTGISRAEVAGALGRRIADKTIRDAWDYLMAVGALRLATPVGSQRSGTGKALWVPPGEEREELRIWRSVSQ